MQVVGTVPIRSAAVAKVLGGRLFAADRGRPNVGKIGASRSINCREPRFDFEQLFHAMGLGGFGGPLGPAFGGRFFSPDV